MSLVWWLYIDKRTGRRISPMTARRTRVNPTQCIGIVSVTTLVHYKIKPFLITKIFPGPVHSDGMSRHRCMRTMAERRSSNSFPSFAIDSLIIIVTCEDPDHVISSISSDQIANQTNDFAFRQVIP